MPNRIRSSKSNDCVESPETASKKLMKSQSAEYARDCRFSPERMSERVMARAGLHEILPTKTATNAGRLRLFDELSDHARWFREDFKQSERAGKLICSPPSIGTPQAIYAKHFRDVNCGKYRPGDRVFISCEVYTPYDYARVDTAELDLAIKARVTFFTALPEIRRKQTRAPLRAVCAYLSNHDYIERPPGRWSIK